MAAIRVKAKNTDTYIIGVYRPNYDIDDALITLGNFLDTLPVWKSNVILMGDINVDSLIPSAKRTKLTEFFKTYNMERLDLPPTRITPHSQTSIDLVCTNYNHSALVDVVNTAISDDTGRICVVEAQARRGDTNFVERRKFKEENLNALKGQLAQQSWEKVYGAQDVDAAYNNLKAVIDHSINITCPFTKSREKKSPRINVHDDETKRLKNAFAQAQENYLLTGNL